MSAEASLPAHIVRCARTDDSVELYFPPFRSLQSAFLLGAFGVFATALPALALLGLLPAALAHAEGLMSAVLVSTFVVPFMAFGIAFVLIALYSACNSLLVRVDEDAITTWRMLFGLSLRRKSLQAREVATIEASIASRDQSPLHAEPVYRLVALNEDRTKRLVVAESLKGEALMERIKALLEEAVDTSRRGNGTERS